MVYMFICHNTAFNIHQLDYKIKLEFCFLLEEISCNYFQPLDEQTVDFFFCHAKHENYQALLLCLLCTKSSLTVEFNRINMLSHPSMKTSESRMG